MRRPFSVKTVFSYQRFFSFEPGRLCRHPSIRTRLLSDCFARCKLGVLNSAGAATCESTSAPLFRRELGQDLVAVT